MLDVVDSHKEPVSQRVIIFDWDDTLCPSSFFPRDHIDNAASLSTEVGTNKRVNRVGRSHRTTLFQAQALLDEIAKCAERCLTEASKYGDVSFFAVVTNCIIIEYVSSP